MSFLRKDKSHPPAFSTNAICLQSPRSMLNSAGSILRLRRHRRERFVLSASLHRLIHEEKSKIVIADLQAALTAIEEKAFRAWMCCYLCGSLVCLSRCPSWNHN